MKLLGVSAKNFRTLQDIKLSFSTNYCTISGKNNAGKSCVIRLLSILFQKGDRYPWLDEVSFDFKDDRTQWVKQTQTIEVSYELQLSRSDDPALISFIEKMMEMPLQTPTVKVILNCTLGESEELRIAVTVNGTAVDDKSAKEIQKKIRDSDLLFLYNSTTRHEEYYYGRGRRGMFYDFVMSEEERKALDVAAKNIENQFRKLAREHKTALNSRP